MVWERLLTSCKTRKRSKWPRLEVVSNFGIHKWFEPQKILIMIYMDVDEHVAMKQIEEMETFLFYLERLWNIRNTQCLHWCLCHVQYTAPLENYVFFTDLCATSNTQSSWLKNVPLSHTLAAKARTKEMQKPSKMSTIHHNRHIKTILGSLNGPNWVKKS